MAIFHSILSFLSFTNIRRTEYGLRPYPATAHTLTVVTNTYYMIAGSKNYCNFWDKKVAV